MKRPSRPVWLLAGALALLTRGAASAQPEPAASIAEDAYVYGYPLVLMDATKQSMTAVGKPGPNGAPVNQFFHAKNLPDPSERWVVRPNLDTLYSTAWLDLSREPIVLHLPEVRDRFYLLQMMDAWTNVFSAPGTRTLHGQAHELAIVGPHWRGTLPAGVMRVQAPTDMVWIIGRTEVKGPADEAAARAVEVNYTLQPLSAWVKKEPPLRSVPMDLGASGEKPPVQVARLDGPAFFRKLSVLMSQNPPSSEDRAALQRFAKIGLEPGQPFAPSPEVAALLAQIPARAQKRIQASALNTGASRDGWRMTPKNIGEFGAQYDERAAVALVGLGANLAADALYPNTHSDGKGRPLSGAHSYLIHFAPGQTPPVSAFWSLTLYDSHGYLVENGAHRYALRDRDPMHKNPDGSLDLYVQAAAPDGELRANWLPAPKGPFNLLLRLYLPKDEALNGQWRPPPVQRRDERNAASR